MISLLVYIWSLLLSSLLLYIWDGHFARIVNPLCPSVSFLYPLKISKNERFSDIFGVYKKGTLGLKGLTTQSFWLVYENCTMVLESNSALKKCNEWTVV